MATGDKLIVTAGTRASGYFRNLQVAQNDMVATIKVDGITLPKGAYRVTATLTSGQLTNMVRTNPTGSYSGNNARIRIAPSALDAPVVIYATGTETTSFNTSGYVEVGDRLEFEEVEYSHLQPTWDWADGLAFVGSSQFVNVVQTVGWFDTSTLLLDKPYKNGLNYTTDNETVIIPNDGDYELYIYGHSRVNSTSAYGYMQIMVNGAEILRVNMDQTGDAQYSNYDSKIKKGFASITVSLVAGDIVTLTNEASDTRYLAGIHEGTTFGIKQLGEAIILPPSNSFSYVTINNTNQASLVDYTNNGDITTSGRDLNFTSTGMYRVHVKNSNADVVPTLSFKGEDVYGFQEKVGEDGIVDILNVSDTLTLTFDKDGEDININGTWLEIEYLGTREDVTKTQYEDTGFASCVFPQNFTISNDTTLIPINATPTVEFAGGIFTIKEPKLLKFSLYHTLYSTNGTSSDLTFNIIVNDIIVESQTIPALGTLEQREGTFAYEKSFDAEDKLRFELVGERIVINSLLLTAQEFNPVPPNVGLVGLTSAKKPYYITFDYFNDTTSDGSYSPSLVDGVIHGVKCNQDGRYKVTITGPRAYGQYSWGDWPLIRGKELSVAGNANQRSTEDVSWEVDVKKGEAIEFYGKRNVTYTINYFEGFKLYVERIGDYRAGLENTIVTTERAFVAQGSLHGSKETNLMSSLDVTRNDETAYENGTFRAPFTGDYNVFIKLNTVGISDNVSSPLSNTDIFVNGKLRESLYWATRPHEVTLSLEAGDNVVIENNDRKQSVLEIPEDLVTITFPEPEAPKSDRLSSLNTVVDKEEEVYLSIYEMDFEKTDLDTYTENGSNLLRDFKIGEILNSTFDVTENSSELTFTISIDKDSDFLIDHPKALYAVRRLKYTNQDGTTTVIKDIAFIYDWEEEDNYQRKNVTFYAFGKNVIQWALLQTNINHVIVEPIDDENDTPEQIEYKESQIQKDKQNKARFVYPEDIKQYQLGGRQFKEVVEDIFDKTLENPKKFGNGVVDTRGSYARKFPNLNKIDTSEMVTSLGIVENIDCESDLWETIQMLSDIYEQEYLIDLDVSDNEKDYNFAIRAKQTFALDMGSNTELAESYRLSRKRSSTPLLINGFGEGTILSQRVDYGKINKIARPIEQVLDNREKAGLNQTVNARLTRREARRNAKTTNIKLDISFMSGNKTYLGDIKAGDYATVTIRNKEYKMEFTKITEILGETGINFLYELENR